MKKRNEMKNKARSGITNTLTIEIEELTANKKHSKWSHNQVASKEANIRVVYKLTTRLSTAWLGYTASHCRSLATNHRA